MGSSAEERTRNFYHWEQRGRGWRSYPYPVGLEPPFVPFRWIRQTARVADDGRHHTFLSGLLDWFSRGKQAPTPIRELEHVEPEPEPVTEDEDLVELRVLLPKDHTVTPGLSEGWLKSLLALQYPASFELVGSGGAVSVVLTARSKEVALLTSQMRAFFPEASLEESEELLLQTWEAGDEGMFSAAELGLAHEFMLPLERPKGFSPDPLTAIVGALAETDSGEVAVLQVLFQGVEAPWAEHVLRSVVTPSGDPFFADAPEITKRAHEKVSAPLFAVAIRIAARSATEERLMTLLYGAVGALSGVTRGDNEFIQLGGGDTDDILVDVILRRTHRPGMLLSLPELMPLVHLPSDLSKISCGRPVAPESFPRRHRPAVSSSGTTSMRAYSGRQDSQPMPVYGIRTWWERQARASQPSWSR
jgi:hypothetical protein